MSIEKCNILMRLPPSQFKEVRRITISAILATDMAHHMELTASFENKTSFQLESQDDRLLLTNTILHACDIGNPVLPRKNAVDWALRVANEFVGQVAQERKLKLNVTQFMAVRGDIEYQNPNVAKLNYNFIGYVVEPLWRTFTDFFPELNECMENLESNRKWWKGIMDGEGGHFRSKATI
jgi:hypothetical protein